MKNERFLILDKNLGVYLGSYDASIFEDEPTEPGKRYAAFAGCNPFGIVHGLTFDNTEQAEIFMYSTFPKASFEVSVASIQLESKVASVLDIIKAGYGDYTHDMLDFWINGEIETKH
jgi:hypothetical protein